jgi:hypothetical protein
VKLRRQNNSTLLVSSTRMKFLTLEATLKDLGYQPKLPSLQRLKHQASLSTSQKKHLNAERCQQRLLLAILLKISIIQKDYMEIQLKHKITTQLHLVS